MPDTVLRPEDEVSAAAGENENPAVLKKSNTESEDPTSRTTNVRSHHALSSSTHPFAAAVIPHGNQGMPQSGPTTAFENPPSENSTSPTDNSYTSIDYEDSSPPRLAGVIVCVVAALIALLLSLVWFGVLVFFLVSIIPCFLCVALAFLSGSCCPGTVQVSTFSINKDDNTNGFVNVQRTWQTRRASAFKGQTTNKGNPLMPSSENHNPTSFTVATIEESRDDEQDPEACLTPIV